MRPKVEVEGFHFHTCGLKEDFYECKVDLNLGCGHVWGHFSTERGKSESHLCPRCGAGPWFSHTLGSDLVDCKEMPEVDEVRSVQARSSATRS